MVSSEKITHTDSASNGVMSLADLPVLTRGLRCPETHFEIVPHIPVREGVRDHDALRCTPMKIVLNEN